MAAEIADRLQWINTSPGGPGLVTPPLVGRPAFIFVASIAGAVTMSAIFWIIVCSPLYFVFKPNPYWPLVASSKRAGVVLAASLGAGSLLMIGALALGFVQPIGGTPPYTPPPPPPVAIPSGAPHHWTFREGREYGYVETLTNEEIKAGKVLADTKLFRYLGLKDHLYSVSTDKGASTLTYACSNPCGMISVTTTTGEKSTNSQVQFDGNKDVDLALTDAINGKMLPYQAEPKPPEQILESKPKVRWRARHRARHEHVRA